MSHRPLSLTILQQCDDWIAVDKPPGWLSIPAPTQTQHNLPVVLHQLQKELAQKLWTVHRLDALAAGVLVFAKNATAHRSLNDLFATRSTQKTYHALCTQLPVSPHGQLGQLKAYIWAGRKGKMRISTTRENIPEAQRGAAKTSLTSWCVLENNILEVKPHEGRRHQIRLTLAYLGAPIAGDTMYYPLARLRGCTKFAETAADSVTLLAKRLQFKWLDTEIDLHSKQKVSDTSAIIEA